MVLATFERVWVGIVVLVAKAGFIRTFGIRVQTRSVEARGAGKAWSDVWERKKKRNKKDFNVTCD
jgi:hypothetical protein